MSLSSGSVTATRFDLPEAVPDWSTWEKVLPTDTLTCDRRALAYRNGWVPWLAPMSLDFSDPTRWREGTIAFLGFREDRKKIDAKTFRMRLQAAERSWSTDHNRTRIPSDIKSEIREDVRYKMIDTAPWTHTVTLVLVSLVHHAIWVDGPMGKDSVEKIRQSLAVLFGDPPPLSTAWAPLDEALHAPIEAETGTEISDFCWTGPLHDRFCRWLLVRSQIYDGSLPGFLPAGSSLPEDPRVETDGPIVFDDAFGDPAVSVTLRDKSAIGSAESADALRACRPVRRLRLTLRVQDADPSVTIDAGHLGICQASLTGMTLSDPIKNLFARANAIESTWTAFQAVVARFLAERYGDGEGARRQDQILDPCTLRGDSDG